MLFISTNVPIIGTFVLLKPTQKMVKGNPRTGDRINCIKEMLVRHSRSQRWLSAELGKTPGTIAAMCNNLSQPHLKDLKRIAELLNVNIKDLLYDTPVK